MTGVGRSIESRAEEREAQSFHRELAKALNRNPEFLRVSGGARLDDSRTRVQYRLPDGTNRSVTVTIHGIGINTLTVKDAKPDGSGDTYSAGGYFPGCGEIISHIHTTPDGEEHPSSAKQSIIAFRALIASLDSPNPHMVQPASA